MASKVSSRFPLKIKRVQLDLPLCPAPDKDSEACYRSRPSFQRLERHRGRADLHLKQLCPGRLLPQLRIRQDLVSAPRTRNWWVSKINTKDPNTDRILIIDLKLSSLFVQVVY